MVTSAMQNLRRMCLMDIKRRVEEIREKAVQVLNEKAEPQNLEAKLKKDLKLKVILNEMESIIQDETLLDEEVFKKLEYVDKELEIVQKT